MSVNRRQFLKTGGATAVGLASVVSATAQSGKPQEAGDAKKAASTPPAEKPKAAPKVAKPKGAAKGSGKKRRVLTEHAPKPAGPYSQAIIANNTIYVSGQIATDPKSGKIEATTFEGQATQVFENIKAIVESAGSSLEQVVSVRVYLASLDDFAKMNTIYREYFAADFPARTTIGAQLLPDLLIEVDCIAVL